MIKNEIRIAEKVLDYWFALEFLSQNKYPDSWETISYVKKHKEKVVRGTAKNKTIEDFILLTADNAMENLYDIISAEALACGMKKWGNLTFYIGKVKRERCIDCISKVLPFESEDDNRPEQSTDKIAWISLQLSPEGNYVEQSLSLSTIIWALHQLKSARGNISDVLDDKLYKNALENLEEKFFDKESMILKNSAPSKGETLQIPREKIEDEEVQTFAATAVTLKKLQELYREIEESYIKGNIENTYEETDAYEEVYGISFQLFADEATKNRKEDDTYLGLAHNYYSDDIKLVLREAETGSLAKDSYLGKNLLEYITVLKDNFTSRERINLVNPMEQGREEYLSQMNEILSVANAPLGKWPSRFMPAFMQQMAINLAIGKGTSKLYRVNGKIFSVNGPPGTGKTTLLKEIVVNNIIERAILLAKWDNPDDAFQTRNFLHGEEIENAYSKFTHHWYCLKDDSINDYSMLVTSCNNAAVENISKELPKSMIQDLSPLDGDADERKTMLEEVGRLFDATQSGTVETTYLGEVYGDIYFTKYARELLENEDVWGVVAAPLGKKSNLSNFYNKVLYPFLRDFYKNKTMASDRVKSYKKARKKFKEQLQIVRAMQSEMRKLGDLLAEKNLLYNEWLNVKTVCEESIAQCNNHITSYNEQLSNLHNQESDLQIKSAACEYALRQLQEEIQAKEQSYSEAKSKVKSSLEKELTVRNSVGRLAKLFKSAKYQAAMNLAEEYKKDAIEQKSIVANIETELATMRENFQYAEELSKNATREYRKLLVKIKEVEQALRHEEAVIIANNKNEEQAKKKYENVQKEYQAEVTRLSGADDIDASVLIDDDFVSRLLSEDIEVSTKAQVDNPWFSQRYNGEREKLFAYAMRLNKEFVISSNHCRDNLITLGHYWGLRPGDEKERILFHKEDKERMVPALFQTLFLLVPVISSTFASVGNLLRDAKETGVVGMLVVDEAGQAQPQMAIGALYRSRRAVIVGDPKQVEPVVTDDLLLLKKAYHDDVLKPYKRRTLSVQEFADQLNSFGTYMENGTDYPEWVGCPLLVHRRCISPMYDISNQISYSGIMKQQTQPPKSEKIEKFIYDKSQWINVVGKEKGNKNHFVEAQGEKVCELLEIAFSKNPQPSLYIISPFTTVVSGIKNYIKVYCRKHGGTTKIDSDYMLDYAKKKIGTVHTFQGKEADEVIFLLGCDSSKDAKGAIHWVNKNIINVAVTRAKYRLYIIGEEEAWKLSPYVMEAKQIMDTFAIKEIKAILAENLPEDEEKKALLEASCNLPPLTSFATLKIESDDGVDYNIETRGLLRGLQEEFIKTELSTEQLEKFGFRQMKDLDGLSPEVKNNLVLGMKLFFLLEPVYKVNNQLDASCCAILFCKAMELQMKDCFTEGLKEVFPDFKIRGMGKGRYCVSLKDAHNRELTLGAFDTIIKNNCETLGRRMKMKGKELYDAKWWKMFENRLKDCTDRRNQCCHSGLFSWREQSYLLYDMFMEVRQTDQADNAMRGILFESNVGKELC